MKGFEISYRNTTQRVGVEDELLTFLLHATGDNAMLYVWSTDYDQQLNRVWHNNSPVASDELIRIRVIDLEEEAISVPVKEVKSEHIRRPSELEAFRNLENLLKEKGLL
ncbi:MAG: hypothetical protein IJ494_10025 [Bacteroides sp.]|nr:hypothetical protein [Bacteroides sp.]